MTAVTTDGYIISVRWLYLADGKYNDAELTKNIMYNNKQGALDWCAANDISVVDRDFLDVSGHLENFEYATKMPSRLRIGEKEFTTVQANKTLL